MGTSTYHALVGTAWVRRLLCHEWRHLPTLEGLCPLWHYHSVYGKKKKMRSTLFTGPRLSWQSHDKGPFGSLLHPHKSHQQVHSTFHKPAALPLPCRRSDCHRRYSSLVSPALWCSPASTLPLPAPGNFTFCSRLLPASCQLSCQQEIALGLQESTGAASEPGEQQYGNRAN